MATNIAEVTINLKAETATIALLKICELVASSTPHNRETVICEILRIGQAALSQADINGEKYDKFLSRHLQP